MLIKKITVGFVSQIFDTDTKTFVSQEFVAGDQCDYEDKDGNPVDTALTGDPEPYLPFDMKQPEEQSADSTSLNKGNKGEDANGQN